MNSKISPGKIMHWLGSKIISVFIIGGFLISFAPWRENVLKTKILDGDPYRLGFFDGAVVSLILFTILAINLKLISRIINALKNFIDLYNTPLES